MAFFKKFFQNIIHDKDPDKDSGKVMDKSQPKFYGSIAPYPNFDASSDASALHKAIKTKGVDENVIISVLVTRNNAQRQDIKQKYEASTGKHLADDLKSAVRSDLEDVVLELLMTPAQLDAYQLRKATKGLGTKEHVLVEILASRSNNEIREIKKVFKEEYKKDLEDVVRSETSGDFTRALLAMLKACRDEDNNVDASLAKQDAKAMFEAGEGTKGTRISVFIDILTSRSSSQLVKALQEYRKHSDVSLPKALACELKGDIEDCLIDIVKCAWSKPAFFAEKLNLAMKGIGTCKSTLSRVIVSRSESDLKKVMEEYKIMYGRSLHEAIREETKGDYEKILLAICGSE